MSPMAKSNTQTLDEIRRAGETNTKLSRRSLLSPWIYGGLWVSNRCNRLRGAMVSKQTVKVVVFDVRDTLGDVVSLGQLLPYRPSTEKLLEGVRGMNAR